MANPTTLLDFRTQQNTDLNAALAKGQTNLTAAQNAYAAAAKARDDANDALSNTAADMASIRVQLGAVPTPEEATALVQKLGADIIQSRLQTGTLAIKARALVDVKAVLDGVTAEVQRLIAAVAASQTALDDATARAKTRNDLKTKLANPPLATIKTDAAAILAGTTFLDPGNTFKFADAQSRLQSDLTSGLFTEAEHRLQDEITRAGSSSGEYLGAQGQVESKWSADLGVNGAVLTGQSVFQRAEARFTDFVVNAGDRFQQAKSALAAVADPTNSPLTPTQKTSITDATNVANATAAIAAEQALDDAVDNLANLQTVLDEKIREAEEADPKADPAADTNVIKATSDRDDARAKVTSAQSDYAKLQAGMTAWEVLVPDSEWQLFYSFELAQLTLNSLDPGTLQSDMDAAELALVNALLAADKSAHTLIELKADVTRRQAMANYESAAAEARRFSALRGDF